MPERVQATEYGGDGGLVQPASKGHNIGAGAADNDAVREEAMMLRMHGRREAAGLPPLTDEELRARLERR